MTKELEMGSPRMQEKEQRENKYTTVFNDRQELPVFIWHKEGTLDYIVSDTPQVLLGKSKVHTMVYSGPYSEWVCPVKGVK